MINIIRKYIPKKITRIFSSDFHKPLGRWGLVHENKDKMDLKVDWSNEDHCGPCGNNSLEKQMKKDTVKINKLQKKLDKIN